VLRNDCINIMAKSNQAAVCCQIYRKIEIPVTAVLENTRCGKIEVAHGCQANDAEENALQIKPSSRGLINFAGGRTMFRDLVPTWNLAAWRNCSRLWYRSSELCKWPQHDVANKGLINRFVKLFNDATIVFTRVTALRISHKPIYSVGQ